MIKNINGSNITKLDYLDNGIVKSINVIVSDDHIVMIEEIIEKLKDVNIVIMSVIIQIDNSDYENINVIERIL